LIFQWIGIVEYIPCCTAPALHWCLLPATRLASRKILTEQKIKKRTGPALWLLCGSNLATECIKKAERTRNVLGIHKRKQNIHSIHRGSRNVLSISTVEDYQKVTQNKYATQEVHIVYIKKTKVHTVYTY
jgi:hypothetical protein